MRKWWKREKSQVNFWQNFPHLKLSTDQFCTYFHFDCCIRKVTFLACKSIYKTLHSVTVGRRYMHLKIFKKTATPQSSSSGLMHSGEVFQKSERLICLVLHLLSNKISFNRFKRNYGEKVLYKHIISSFIWEIHGDFQMAISRAVFNRFPFSFF